MKIVSFLIVICLVALDPGARANAPVDRYLATTDSARAARAEVQAHSPQVAEESPVVFAQRFLDLESTSMPEHWDKLSKFFVDAPKPQWNQVHIVDLVDVGADVGDGTAEVSISTNLLGNLNSSLQLSSYPALRLPLIIPSASACYGDHYFDFDLVLSPNQQANKSFEESKDQLGWKIKDSSFEPLITLGAGIRYVTEAGSKTTDPAIRKNASRTLAILNHFRSHPGRPLPGKLASEAGGPC